MTSVKLMELLRILLPSYSIHIEVGVWYHNHIGKQTPPRWSVYACEGGEDNKSTYVTAFGDSAAIVYDRIVAELELRRQTALDEVGAM